MDTSSKVVKQRTPKKVKFSMAQLTTAFGKDTFQAALPSSLPKNGTSQVTYQTLPTNFELMLNRDGPLVDCFLTSAGSLATYNFSEKDVDTLNGLLHYLIKALNVKPTYKPIEMEKGNDSLMTKFFQCDARTHYYNKDSLIVRNLPVYCFHAQVVIKVMGLQYESFEGYDGVKLIIHIHQVKVMDEYGDMNDIIGEYMLVN